MTARFSTEGLARASAIRPWRTIGLWIMALLASGVLIVSLLGDALTTNGDFTGTPEAKQARTLIDEQLWRPDNVTEIVLVRSATMTVDDPAFEQRVTEIAIDLAAFNATLDTLYVNGAPDLVSPDRDPTMITIQLHNDSDENIEALVNSVVAADDRAGFETGITGMNVTDADFRTVAEEDLQKGEFIGVLVALGVLVIVFGAVIASGPRHPRRDLDRHRSRPDGARRRRLRALVLRREHARDDGPRGSASTMPSSSCRGSERSANGAVT